ncbi:uncharacterized protein PAC_03429 [Phialocephala subalpina]|uniref:CHK kinase-like domain-containing protein n=1 Tax=Phialocephala subalpina TaxID=576137 RepID=A0A1L7WLB1_9HELO|nr:uncharacterized protein PAC_03429 [Phialocephala subalpina]
MATLITPQLPSITKTEHNTLDVTSVLPMTIEELGPKWLSLVLGRRCPGLEVHSVETRNIIYGTASKILVRLKYLKRHEKREPPEDLCIKGGFQQELRDIGLGSSYRREAEFFAHIAPHLDIQLPQSWYAGISTELDQGIVIMENLTSRGCTYGECTETWPADRVAAALEVLAGLHAHTWGADSKRYPWLSNISPVKEVSEILLSAEYWDRHFEVDEADLKARVPKSMLDREKMKFAFEKLWQLSEQGPICAAHGDPHVGNTYISADGKPGFIDWQALYAGPPMDDVAYFIGGALTIEDRRNHERRLLQHYLGSLKAQNGPSFTVDEVWPDYRRNHLHGFFWALTSPKMQRKDRVIAMTERHITAIEDHKTLDAILGSV